MENPPPLFARTVAEINSRLIDDDPGASRSDAAACPDAMLSQERSAHDISLPGTMAVSPAGLWPSEFQAASGGELVPSNPVLKALEGIIQIPLNFLSKALQYPASSSTVHPSISCFSSTQSIAWHPTDPVLAASDENDGLQLFHFKGQVPYLGQTCASPPLSLSPTRVIHHELQQGAAESGAIAWRPIGNKSIAVASGRGVCLWHVTREHPSLVWLQSPGESPVHALAWHPKGRVLAGASNARRGLFVWDVATGTATTVRAGLERVSILRWSPCGSYLFAGGDVRGGGFRIYETATWTSASWALNNDGFAGTNGRGAGTLVSTKSRGGRGVVPQPRLVGAEWAPDGRTLLLAHSTGLSTLHFTAQSPELSAQVLPVVLDELATQGGASQGRDTIVSVAWDGSGKRLAVALGDGHATAPGCLAIYDTLCDPILSARFLGYARVGPRREGEDQDWEMVDEAEAMASPGAVGAGNDASGGGSMAQGGKEALSLAFWPGFEQGALLSVKKGNGVSTIPLYFAS